MRRITFLGQGAMGARMADRLESAGYDVTRWNRTGADRTPRAAAEGAEIVIAMVRDDPASTAVWLGDDGALAGMAPGALAIESSTVTVAQMHALGACATTGGIGFLDAPVLGSRPQAEAGQLIHLLGGHADVIRHAEPVLEAIGAKRLHAGPVGAGAALKLLANALFGIQVAVLAELAGRTTELGLEPARAFALLGETPLLSPAAKAAASLMISGQHTPMFPIELLRKDLGYAIGDSSASMPITGATAGVFDAAVRQGLGHAHLTAVIELYHRTDRAPR